MTKKKLLMSLIPGLIGALVLTGCNEVTSKDNAVVTLKDANGKEVTIVANEVYSKYRRSSDGLSKFYNAILEALIRYEYEAKTGVGKKSLEEVKQEAASNVKDDKATAEANASTNGTSYSTEWESILTSHGCEDEAELLQYYIYQIEKEEVTDKYFLDNRSGLTTEYIGVTKGGEKPSTSSEGVFPYHIRHTLVSISAGGSDYYNGVITADEAKNLGDTVKHLSDGQHTFADVALSSGDTGSGAKGGDVGIMTTTTSFVNEFKLGIYAYDTLWNASHGANSVVEKGLGFNDDYTFAIEDPIDSKVKEMTASSYFTNLGLKEVPYDAFIQIGEYANDTTDEAGKSVNDGNEHFYPRNVLWNYYCNLHNPFVITNQKINGTTGLPETNAGAGTRFNSDGVLTDEKGNVIIGVRSTHGIHFMIIQKSIYDFANTGVSLEDYYTTYVPGDSDYPGHAEGQEKSTYVNYIESTVKADYSTRANEVKSAIKSFDSTYDYRVYEKFVAADTITFNNTDGIDLGQAIKTYISETRIKNSLNSAKTLNEAWRTYAELIATQYDSRLPSTWTDVTTVAGVDDPIAPSNYRIVHPRCAVGFAKHNATEWSTGGVCHYEA